MAKNTKVSIKVKGSPKGVKKAISDILNQEPPSAPTMRQADFRDYQKRNNNAR